MVDFNDITSSPQKKFAVIEIARALSIEKATVYDWIRQGKIEATKKDAPRYVTGYTWEITGQALLDYLVKAGEEARAEYQKELLDV